VKSFKKILINFFIFISISAHAQNSIQINTVSQFIELENLESGIDSIDLFINNIKLESKDEKKVEASFGKWLGRQNVRRITFKNIKKIRSNILTWIIRMLPDSQLVSLKLFNVKIKGQFRLPVSHHYTSLKRISIINTIIGKAALKSFNPNNLPALKHLELINCQLDDDYIPLIEKAGLMPQLEYLDLSQNELTNAVFSLFPQERPGNLKSLLLNKCDLTLDKKEDYESGFLAFNRHVAKTEFFVDWDTPFFGNLEHLEVQNKIKKLREIKASLAEEKFQDLKIFYGFLLEDNTNHSRGGKAKYDKKLQKYIEMTTSFPFKSIRTNLDFSAPNFLNIFLKSEQAKICENINLSGDRWNYLALKTFLSSKAMPSLKEVSIINTPVNQDEAKKLIQEFAAFNFSFIMRKTGGHWPGVTTIKAQ
jgi:hypothetical protein